MSLFRDERGKYSAARALLALWTTFTVYVIVRVLNYALDGTSSLGDGRVEVIGGVLTLISAVLLAHVAWNAGPRMAQYLAPMAARMTSAIGRAFKRDERYPSMYDDERYDG